MAINPELITTIRVDQLPDEALSLTNLFPHTVGTDLKSATIQELVDLVATTIGVSGGVGYIAISVTDGQQLPDVPELPSFFLCGAGTFLNINGYPDVICTDELNAVMSLSDHWQLAVGIPIVAEVGVQTVTGSAVDNTDPLNPVINEIISGVQNIIAGTNITVDNTDPANPIVSSTGGGTTPTLQEVATEGNTLTDTDIIFDSAFSNNEILINVNDGIYVKAIDSDKQAFIEQSALGISNYDGTNTTFLLEEGFNHTSSGGFQKLTFDTIASDEEIIIPNASGTIALTSDINTPTLQQVLEEGDNATINGVGDLSIIYADGTLSSEIYQDKNVASITSSTDTDNISLIADTDTNIFLTKSSVSTDLKIRVEEPTGVAGEIIIKDPVSETETVAFLSDITTPTLQQVTDEGNETTNRIIVIESDVTSITINNNNIERVEYDLNASTQLTFQNSENNNNIIAFPDASGTLALTSDIPSSSTFVPYTGATTNVDLGEFELKAGQVEFDQTPTGTAGVGVMRWNDTDGTADLGLKGGNVTLQIGQEEVVRVVNKTATNINLLQANYQAVRVTGAQGQRLKVDLAQATNDTLSAETIGLVTETINNNQEGFITTNGLVRNINTTGSLQGETWADGDIVYLSATTAGNITNVKPLAPNHLVIIGYVVSAHITQGSIFVKVDVGYELDELHNVSITTPLNNQALTYETSSDLWKNKTIIEDSITDGVTDKAPSQNSVFDALALKQATLVSGTNIKTINGTSVLGSGDLVVGGSDELQVVLLSQVYS